jgi:methionine synthase II (cobalamin-independent)
MNSEKTINISKDILIEDLIEIFPGAVTFLMEKGIRCLKCGEPAWGTLEDAAKEKGFDTESINSIVKDLNALINPKNSLVPIESGLPKADT